VLRTTMLVFGEGEEEDTCVSYEEEDTCATNYDARVR